MVSPFTSVAKYDRFKQAENTDSRVYKDRFTEFTTDEISYNAGLYQVNKGGTQLSFNDPNFSFNEFRSNLVARWEYLPGSTLYLVWEHNRSNRDDIYQTGWGNNLDRMFGLPASNTFMMKFNYWLNM
ncbi:DUF5916 domain-containing protein [Sphingobacterium sp. SG20118]|uniref:DUF5916 domain-containing protein n=1 Tax=Sphingobacterium sp. SG20118 TaxID=3367156 RepID=UPI0037DFC108